MANGKGSGRRPAAIPDAQVQTEWDRIFGAPKPKSDLERAAEAFLRDNPEGGYFEYPLQRPAQRPLTTDLGSEFIRSIHDVARGARGQ